MKNYKIFTNTLRFGFLFFFINIQCLLAQDEFMLTANEMLSGYEFVHFLDNHWAVGQDSVYKIKEQVWRNGDKWILIGYGIFDDELSALKAMGYFSQSFSVLYKWGSLDGQVLGDMCWYEGNINYSNGLAKIFVRGDVGIQIAFTFDNPKEFSTLSKTILNKIEANLSDDVKTFENTLREKQFPEASYSTITNTLVQSNLKDYNLEETWDSKWLTNQDKVKMGIRKIWKNQDSSVVVIDLCQFESDMLAKSAAETRASYGPWVATEDSGSYEYYSLDSIDNLSLRVRTIISQDSLMNGKTKSYSFAGLKGNMAAHVHFYNPKGINPDTVYSVIKTLSGDIINFLVTSVFQEDRNTEVIKVFKLEQNYPNPFNPKTRIPFNLQKREFVEINIFDINGRKVDLLVSKIYSAGSHYVDFDADDLASGIYYYKISVNNYTEVKKAILIK